MAAPCVSSTSTISVDVSTGVLLASAIISPASDNLLATTSAGLYVPTPKAATLVTALPGNPFDGQLIYYVADATKRILWAFRYNAGSASAYKWEAVPGGGPLYNEIDTPESVASTSYVNLATVGPQIVVPLGGDYVFDYGATLVTSAAVTQFATINKAGVVNLDVDSISYANPSAATGGASVSRRRLFTGLLAGQTYLMQYRASVGTVQASSRWMSASPIRVG